jgi:mRNA interferase HigB
LDAVRVLSRSTLRVFWEKHRGAQGPLRAWLEEAEAADWKSPQDIKERYRTADFIANDRAIFDIGGNKYRLVVHVRYEFHVVYIRFVGTHREYDEIDATTV